MKWCLKQRRGESHHFFIHSLTKICKKLNTLEVWGCFLLQLKCDTVPKWPCTSQISCTGIISPFEVTMNSTKCFCNEVVKKQRHSFRKHDHIRNIEGAGSQYNVAWLCQPPLKLFQEKKPKNDTISHKLELFPWEKTESTFFFCFPPFTATISFCEVRQTSSSFHSWTVGALFRSSTSCAFTERTVKFPRQAGAQKTNCVLN